MHGVAADLDAGAEPRELLRLLVDGDVVAGLAQRRRRGEPAHAGADDGDVEFRHASRHSTPPAGRGLRRRRLDRAARLGDRAARMEAAARRDVGGVGQDVAQPDIGHAEPRLGRQHRGEQRLGVGMLGRAEQRLGRRALDEAAEIHHRHFARDMLDHGEVVADEEIGEAEVAAQLGQKVQDLRLHRDVERAGRLVAHHDARAQHQGAGDGDALALAARQLGRQAVAHLGASGRRAPASRRRAWRSRRGRYCPAP